MIAIPCNIPYSRKKKNFHFGISVTPYNEFILETVGETTSLAVA